MTQTNRRPPASALARAGALMFLAFLLLPIGGASAATTITRMPAGHEIALGGGAPVAPAAVALVAHALFHFARGAPGPTTRAGVQSIGVVGASGSTSVLPACGKSPCTDSYRGAGTARPRAGDWGVEVQLTVTQPSATTGTATGFAVQVAVETRAGWTVVFGYLSTGTNPSAASRTIDLDVFLDLGVTIRPALLVTDIVLTACATTAACR